MTPPRLPAPPVFIAAGAGAVAGPPGADESPPAPVPVVIDEAGPADREAKLVSAGEVLCQVVGELGRRAGAPDVYAAVLAEYRRAARRWTGQ